MTDLPIEEAIPALRAALRAEGLAVLEAPPGAGKTTRVPLALMDEDWASGGRILMLEPRRVAARAAAERMAETLGEAAGERIGYRIRGESRVSGRTRVEVLTEGILTRRMQGDPGLEGVACVIFDEFHERSIHADLGIALCLQARSLLRPDLRILIMSATLDGESVAQLMGGAPVIRSEGRAFPVALRWRASPPPPAARIEPLMAEAILEALAAEPAGDLLAFLPGAPEIGRVQAALSGRLPSHVEAIPLHGALPFAEQRRALLPAPEGRRRVVLATSIAETSLTLPGVRIVVDGGKARRARFDAGAGMSRLVTERVSKAEAAQRAGRAGRVAPGTAWRLWTEAEEGALSPQPPPEIREADLSALALDLAIWGAAPEDLLWLDPPPAAAYAQGVELLKALGALDAEGRPTPHGRAMASAPLGPRLGHMLLSASPERKALAARLAALLEDRGVLRGEARRETDLRRHLEALADPGRYEAERGGAVDRPARARILEEAKRLAKGAPPEDAEGLGALAALAFPDRVAQRRKGDAPRYLLSGGKGGFLDPGDPLGDEPWLVAADLDGDLRETRIRRAAPISRAEILDVFADRLQSEEVCQWSRPQGASLARRRRRFGALILEEEAFDPGPEGWGLAAVEGLRDLGLSALDWSAAAQRLRGRVEWLTSREGAGSDLPDWSDAGLLASAEEWLAPFAGALRRTADFARFDPTEALRAALGPERLRRLDRRAPGSFETPAGTRAPIDYAVDPPALEARLQHLFGLARHPSIDEGRAPLAVRLLSPADRPMQTTGDLPAFWRGAYAELRKEMRGRYPRHEWPEDPAAAAPTTRARPRKT
ncbi:ATP-dependent helicase HrpB [Neomegalonema sp.]|uniref:ATP-dependent helicase HrpB n=1 Tax=Neomegalonema sp. TaxID=2039713 RepID=UPI00262CE109|nr:ATP-dependent helicase HrpB [Neomegalonema sp.]MDD2867117.1 ATP-dependent helicase HrpB [Neomegalonema sp.]